jgi:superkiller protein 3
LAPDMALLFVEKVKIIYHLNFYQGTILYRKGRVEEGIRCYDQAIEKDAKCAEAFYNKGCALEN